MSMDIAARCRQLAADKARPVGELWEGLEQAADEIERLRRADEWCRMTIAERDAEIERLRAALRAIIEEVGELGDSVLRKCADIACGALRTST